LKSIVNNSNLKSLSISEFAGLMELPGTFELGTLSALESLTIDRCNEMESLSEQLLQGLSSLERLEISDCPKLSSLPDNFQQLTNLMELNIGDCPMLEKRCKRGIGEDWHKIAHIPKLYLNSNAEPTKPTICGNLI